MTLIQLLHHHRYRVMASPKPFIFPNVPKSFLEYSTYDHTWRSSQTPSSLRTCSRNSSLSRFGRFFSSALARRTPATFFALLSPSWSRLKPWSDAKARHLGRTRASCQDRPAAAFEGRPQHQDGLATVVTVESWISPHHDNTYTP